MSMLLMIYALGNLHVVSLGTRETKETSALKPNTMTKRDISAKLIESYVDNDSCAKYFR